MSTQTFSDFIAKLEEDRDIAEHLHEMKPSQDLAFMLVSIRKKLNWSQADLAKRAGVSQPYIAQLESGIANPSIRKMHSLLRRAGVDLRMEAVIAAAPAIDEKRIPVHETAQARGLNEGEVKHLLHVLDGAIQAISRARVDGKRLTKEQILGEIASSYDAERFVVRPPEDRH